MIKKTLEKESIKFGDKEKVPIFASANQERGAHINKLKREKKAIQVVVLKTRSGSNPLFSTSLT